MFGKHFFTVGNEYSIGRRQVEAIHKFHCSGKDAVVSDRIPKKSCVLGIVSRIDVFKGIKANNGDVCETKYLASGVFIFTMVGFGQKRNLITRMSFDIFKFSVTTTVSQSYTVALVTVSLKI